MRQVGLDDNSIHELPVPLGLSHSGPYRTSYGDFVVIGVEVRSVAALRRSQPPRGGGTRGEHQCL